MDPVSTSTAVAQALNAGKESRTGEYEATLIRKVLNTSEDNAVQLLQMMGIGQSLDVKA